MSVRRRGVLRVTIWGGPGDGKSAVAGRLASEAGPRAASGERCFSTALRQYVVADLPCGMPTAAATPDVAVIVVDAARGALADAQRQSLLVSYAGVQCVALAVNKMDLIGYSQVRFRQMEAQYKEFAERIGVPGVACIPVCALHGDNLLLPSARMPWHGGGSLMEWLEAVDLDEQRLQRLPLRLWVQERANAQQARRRTLDGSVASGIVAVGDRIRLQPSGRQSRVTGIVAEGGDVDRAAAGQPVALTLADELDVSLGDLLTAADDPAEVADQFEATVIWMSDQPMLRGRSYLMKLGTRSATATIAPLKYRIDAGSLEHLAAERLELGEIGVCELELDQAIAFDPYAKNRETGRFILVDSITRHPVGYGMLHFALRRAHNVHLQHVEVNKAARTELKRQKACVLWFTGISASGKSTLANLVEKKLHAAGRHTYLLDGDNVRHGLNKDLGFTAEDRVENIRRIAEVARLMVDAGLIVLTAFISPFRAERRMARALFEQGEFIEVFVDTPLSIAEQRDPKGLYRKARRGEIRNFTGIDSPYEVPEAPEVRIDTAALAPETAADTIIAALERLANR